MYGSWRNHCRVIRVKYNNRKHNLVFHNWNVLLAGVNRYGCGIIYFFQSHFRWELHPIFVTLHPIFGTLSVTMSKSVGDVMICRRCILVFLLHLFIFVFVLTECVTSLTRCSPLSVTWWRTLVPAVSRWATFGSDASRRDSNRTMSTNVSRNMKISMCGR